MSVRVRFAPSPTGHLHVGNVRTALYNWLFARQQGGSFVLRIEDTDQARSEIRYEEQLVEDLRWLGLSWDEGLGKDGGYGPYRQTDRLPLYQDHARQLVARDLAYFCFCSAGELELARTEQLAAGQQPRYSGKCRRLSQEEVRKRLDSGEPASLRFKVRQGSVGFNDLVFGRVEVDCSVIGDFILLRSDGTPQYNFAVVVDDLQMQISHVIRGEGHISNTHRQVLLYEALDFKPPVFAHLSTILGKDGAKLSKRHGATSIEQFSRQGYLPEALVNYLALLGWAPREEGREILSREELVSEFDLSRVNKSPAVFDIDKLNWINRSHLKNAPSSRLVELAIPYFRRAGWIREISTGLEEWLGDVLQAVLGYLDKMEDVAEASRLIFQFDPERDLADPEVQNVLAGDEACKVIDCFYEQIRAEDNLTLESYRDAVQSCKKQTGVKGKNLFHPIRVAVTARASGPELDKLVPVFERGSRLDLPSPIPGVKERVHRVRSILK